MNEEAEQLKFKIKGFLDKQELENESQYFLLLSLIEDLKDEILEDEILEDEDLEDDEFTDFEDDPTIPKDIAIDDIIDVPPVKQQVKPKATKKIIKKGKGLGIKNILN